MAYANDLHRKGELNKVEAMERLARKKERESNGGLAAAFLTQGYYNADCFAMIEQTSDFQDKSGHVVYDEDLKKAVFILDADE